MYRSLTQAARQHLTDVLPNRRVHFVAMLFLLVAAGLRLVYQFTRYDSVLIIGMALIVGAGYWWLHTRLIRAAVYLNRLDWHSRIADDHVGTVTGGQILRAKITAVLRHHRPLLLCMVVILTGFALALASFFRYWNNDTFPYPQPALLDVQPVFEIGLWTHISNTPVVNLTRMPLHPGQILVAAMILSGMLIFSALLSAAIGLWSGTSLRRGLMMQLLIVVAAFGIGNGLHLLRQNSASLSYTAFECEHGYNVPESECAAAYESRFSTRVVESAITSLSVFLDGGAAAVNMGLDPAWHYATYVDYHTYTVEADFSFPPSAVRHLLAIALAAAVQLTLTGLFLRQAVRYGHAKKKAG